MFDKKHKGKSYMPLKLDMEKAYDKLECDFIKKKCFSDLGFFETTTNSC